MIEQQEKQNKRILLTNIEQYSKYYHHERIHQSLGQIIEPKYNLDDQANVQCIKRLGGLLKSYYRLSA